MLSVLKEVLYLLKYPRVTLRTTSNHDGVGSRVSKHVCCLLGPVESHHEDQLVDVDGEPFPYAVEFVNESVD